MIENEKSDSLERLEQKEINFNDTNLEMDFEITPEADEYLPLISPDDLQAKKERFRIFYGNVNQTKQGKIIVSIDSVIEMPDQPEFYEEATTKIKHINYSHSKDFIDRSKKQLGEQGELIGEIHTHPVTQSELPKNQAPWFPGLEDLDAWVDLYDSGFLKPGQPFIFGIAGAHEGKTVYAFYRLVKDSEGWYAMMVE